MRQIHFPPAMDLSFRRFGTLWHFNFRACVKWHSDWELTIVTHNYYDDVYQTHSFKLIEIELCIYASVDYSIIGSDNALSPIRRQAIIEPMMTYHDLNELND